MSDPLLPIRTHKDIASGYVSLNQSDQVIVNFETSRLLTISSISGNTTKGATDHNIVTAPNDSICAMTASWSGSNSGYWATSRMQLSNRGFGSSLTSTSALDSDIGIFAVRKKMFDLGIEKGSLTATATGTAYGGGSIAGDYYDSGSGALIRKSDGATVGAVLLDEGMFVVTSSTVREIATSVTSVSFKTRMGHTNINVFCKCGPNELNYTLNNTAVSTDSISSATDTSGVIGQSYNNLYTQSSLTGSTGRFKYWSDLVSSGYKFSPVISHVGLYNDDNDLIAVAKFAAALKKPTDLPLSVRVSIDI